MASLKISILLLSLCFVFVIYSSPIGPAESATQEHDFPVLPPNTYSFEVDEEDKENEEKKNQFSEKAPEDEQEDALGEDDKYFVPEFITPEENLLTDDENEDGIMKYQEEGEAKPPVEEGFVADENSEEETEKEKGEEDMEEKTKEPEEKAEEKEQFPPPDHPDHIAIKMEEEVKNGKEEPSQDEVKEGETPYTSEDEDEEDLKEPVLHQKSISILEEHFEDDTHDGKDSDGENKDENEENNDENNDENMSEHEEDALPSDVIEKKVKEIAGEPEKNEEVIENNEGSLEEHPVNEEKNGMNTDEEKEVVFDY